jgi:hypothetical protein
LVCLVANGNTVLPGLYLVSSGQLLCNFEYLGGERAVTQCGLQIVHLIIRVIGSPRLQ